MKKISSLCMASIAAIFCVSPSYSAPNITVTALKFSKVEANSPRDPLTRDSSAGHWTATPHGDIAAAEASINGAIPSGTNAALAQATLQNAGAHCVASGGMDLNCRYFDVQTIDEYLDDVRWNASVHLNGDAVQNVSLERAYTRH